MSSGRRLSGIPLLKRDTAYSSTTVSIIILRIIPLLTLVIQERVVMMRMPCVRTNICAVCLEPNTVHPFLW